MCEVVKVNTNYVLRRDLKTLSIIFKSFSGYLFFSKLFSIFSGSPYEDFVNTLFKSIKLLFKRIIIVRS